MLYCLHQALLNLKSGSRFAAFWCCLSLSVFCSPIQADTTKTILFLGDSLTAAYGISKKDGFVNRIQQRLFADRLDIQVVEAGISGSTSASALSRLRWHLRADISILVLALGANDGLRGFDPQVTYNNLAKTIELAKQQGMVVVLAGMKALPNYGVSYAREYEQVFAELADQYQLIFMPFLLQQVAGVSDLNLADGIHPNEQGHQRISDNLLPYIHQALQQLSN